MSQIYISGLVNLLAALLPALGLNIGDEALTTTIQTLVLVGSALWILIRRLAMGDIGLSGVRKS